MPSSILPPAALLNPAKRGVAVYSKVDYVPVGDGTYKAVPQPPIETASIALAAKLTGLERDNLYKLYATGFIKGFQASPRKIRIFMDSLYAHIEKSKDPEFWTKERRKRYLLGLPE